VTGDAGVTAQVSGRPEMVQNGVSVVRRSSDETTCKKTESFKFSKEYGGAKIRQESKTRSKWMVSRVLGYGWP
jgi:hypothetical protein